MSTHITMHLDTPEGTSISAFKQVTSAEVIFEIFLLLC